MPSTSEWAIQYLIRFAYTSWKKGSMVSNSAELPPKYSVQSMPPSTSRSVTPSGWAEERHSWPLGRYSFAAPHRAKKLWCCRYWGRSPKSSSPASSSSKTSPRLPFQYRSSWCCTQRVTLSTLCLSSLYCRPRPQAWFTCTSSTTRIPSWCASATSSWRRCSVPKPRSTRERSDVQKPWYSPFVFSKSGERATTVTPSSWR
mmetsp:Transcript_13960/g.36972  ORF Transcript_13960/g.36972 Transcript_13960/m.36972 type:complete len:201 (+) Transcript_13960:2749-3351(+)